MNKLFESKKQLTAITAPDAHIIWHHTPFMQYEQFSLNDNFRQYLKRNILSKKVFHMEIQKTSQKSHELPTGAQSYTFEFATSLIFQKSNKRLTIYDSYNLEVGSALVQNVPKANLTNTYRVANELKYDIYVTQFVTCNCNGCSIAPLIDYAKSLIYQKLSTKSEYFTNAAERFYLDLRESLRYTNELEKLGSGDNDLVLKINLRNPLNKQMRLRVWGYSQSEYLYLLTERGLKMKCKTCSISKGKGIANRLKQR